MVTIRIPALPRGAATNLLGLLGLIAVTLAVGGLAGNWWWSVLTGGILAVGLAALAQRAEGVQDASAEQSEPMRPVSRLGVA